MSDPDRRVREHPILGHLSDALDVRFSFNGREIVGREGDVIAAALMAHGIRTLRATERFGAPRGIYCAIGHCYDCRVIVDGVSGVRACLTPIREGMRVESGQKLPDSEEHH